MAFWPKEHGAYGQLAFPLITSLAVGGITISALLITVSAVAGFVAHEPLMVLLGGRGIRAVRGQQRAAITWLTFWGLLALASGMAALAIAPAAVRWSFLLPLVPTALLASTFFTKSEKGTLGEIAVALAFSMLAAPICLVSGTRAGTALGVGIAFAAVFVTSTLSVRVIVLKVRSGGNPRAVRATRRVALLLTAGVAAALLLAGTRNVLPATTLVAAAPSLITAVVLVLTVPPPSRLRTVGWTLVATSATAALILIVGLAGPHEAVR